MKFKIYDEHLIFESMNNYINNINNLNTMINNTDIYEFNQAFVDTIRSEGVYNEKRLLIICGDFDMTGFNYLSGYIIPNDPSNKLALSVHFYFPLQFTSMHDGITYHITLPQGFSFDLESLNEWGSQSDYNTIISLFDLLRNFVNDKGIPVIIVEFGVFTEDKKEKESIREYLYAMLSFANDYKGISPCL